METAAKEKVPAELESVTGEELEYESGLPEDSETEDSPAEKSKKRKKHIAAAGVAIFTSASLIVGGLFNSPAALVDDKLGNPVAIVQDADDADDDDDDSGSSGEDEPERVEEALSEDSKGFRAAARDWVMGLPLYVRLLVILPLWGVGWLLLTVLSALIPTLFGKIISWLILLIAIIGAFVLAAKTVFPDLPIKKILNKKSISFLAVGTVTLAVLDCVIPIFWDGYAKIQAIVSGAGILLVFASVTVSFAVKEHKRRVAELEKAEEIEEAEEEEAEDRPWTREDILALADSVSRPRK